MPKEYRVIMYTVNAEQVTPQTVDQIALWTGGRAVTEVDALDSSIKFAALNVPTIAGIRRAQEGDFVYQVPNVPYFQVLPAQEFLEKFERS